MRARLAAARGRQASRLPLASRIVCTGPKLGAVKVANTNGCSTTVGHALAAPQPGRDELPGVAAVDLRARRAHMRAPVPARLQQHAVRLALGRELAHDLARRRIRLTRGAPQVHRLPAPPRALDPALVASPVSGSLSRATISRAARSSNLRPWPSRSDHQTRISTGATSTTRRCTTRNECSTPRRPRARRTPAHTHRDRSYSAPHSGERQSRSRQYRHRPAKFSRGGLTASTTRRARSWDTSRSGA